jgi:two-component system KDP operon response regulator KdpE
MGEPTVLVVEDEPEIRRFLRLTLAAQGYRVLEATTGAQALVEAASRQPDLVVLDLGLPDLDGFVVLRRLREWSSVPVIILSARGEESDKVTALDAGADDYVGKPFGAAELLARARVALRHGARRDDAAETALAVGGLAVDLLRRRVIVDGREAHLTPIEFRLLAALARRPGRVLTHRQLLLEVWGPSHVDQPHYLRVFMAQLRRKLERDPARPRYLLTEPGVGYRVAEE